MIRTVEPNPEPSGVRFERRFAEWPKSRQYLLDILQGGEDLPEDQKAAEVRAFDAALAAYREIGSSQRPDRQNQKLHIGSALVTVDGRTYSAHNDVSEHAEEGVLRGLVKSFEKISQGEPLPRIAALALVGVHAQDELRETDPALPTELDASQLPKATPTPCYKCLYKIHRAVKDIAESRAGSDGVSPDLNFPILVSSTSGGQILRTDYKTIASLPWPGTIHAKPLSKIV